MRCMNDKGQYLTLEQMFLFSIGAIICISVIFSFNYIREDVKEESIENQALEVGEFVSSNIFEVYRTSRNAEYVNKTVDIPEEISNEYYTLSIDESQQYLNVIIDQKEINVDIFNITEEVNFDTNAFVSSPGGSLNIVYFEITGDKDVITIER